MYRASTLLTNARIDKDYQILEIAKKLKVPVKYLEAFETEKKSDFPSEPYCSLILKDYAEFLGLNSQEILCFFRRDFDQKRTVKDPTKIRFSFTPQYTFSIAVIGLVIIFSTYLFSEYIKFNQPPKLKINWPVESTIFGSSFDLSGTTDPESTVKINGDLIIVETDGSFHKKINFNSNEAKVKVESHSSSGKVTVEEKSIKITR